MQACRSVELRSSWKPRCSLLAPRQLALPSSATRPSWKHHQTPEDLSLIGPSLLGLILSARMANGVDIDLDIQPADVPGFSSIVF